MGVSYAISTLETQGGAEMTTRQRSRLVSPPTVGITAVNTAPYGLVQEEIDILFLLREGLYVPQIAAALDKPQAVVEEHVSSLLGKMNARSKTEAAVIAIREHIFGRG
jgi:DNA-binding NarL/FixJ family response regulator